MKVHSIALTLVALVALQGAAPAGAAQTLGATGTGKAVTTDVPVPADYVIGADDVISIVAWKDKDLTVDVVVRPDGKITLPLGKEIVALNLTPDQLKTAVLAEYARYVESPTVNIVVKQINSRRVFITGMVEKPGAYPLVGPTTVMQLIAVAGGLREYAKSKQIILMRAERGATIAYTFNYDEILKRRRLEQNLVLRPGDTVIVP